jgi:parallel beta-helix repeat protein
MPKESDYIVWKNGSTYYAGDGITGQVVYSGTVFSTVMNSLTTALASTGGSIFIKRGAYTQTACINSTGTLTVRGEERDTTVITISGNVQMWYHVTGAADKLLTMSDLTYDGARGTGGQTEGSTTQGIKIYNSARFNNVKVINTAQTGITAIMDGSAATVPDVFYVTNSRFDNTGSITGANAGFGPAIRWDFEGGASANRIRHIEITGNIITNANEHGVKGYENAADFSYVAHNNINTTWKSGIFICNDAVVTGNHLYNIGVAGIGGAAIYLARDGIITVSENYINTTTAGTDGIGVQWTSAPDCPPDAVTIVNNYIVGSGGQGILIKGNLNESLVSGNRILTSADCGIWIGTGCNRTEIKNNRISGSTTAAIRLNDAHYTTISGNSITDGYGIYVSAGSDYTYTHDNDFVCGTAVFSAALAAHDVVKNNRGYINEATGTANFTAATTLQITHGLVSTPTKVFAQGSDTNSAKLWITSIGATTFTINRDNSTGTPAIYWQAEI